MAQLCHWTKVRTKQWLVLDASAFQCMRAGFLCPKCDNFTCLHTSQDQNKLHLKRWFFLPKSASSVSRLQGHFPALFKRIHNHICSRIHQKSICLCNDYILEVKYFRSGFLCPKCDNFLDQNPHKTVARFGWVGFCAGFLCPKCDNFVVLFTYPPRSKWASSEKMIFFAKIGIFCKSMAGPTPEPIELCVASYQGLYAKCVSMMFPKCSIVENEGELLLMALLTHFLLQ